MSSPTRPGVKRVEQLIALATDPAASEEEARSAALQAARTIRRDGLVVTAPGQARAPIYSSASYDTSVTPQGRQLGMGTPALPQRRQAPGRRELAPPVKGGVHVLDLDFKDEIPETRQDFAFPQALLRK